MILAGIFHRFSDSGFLPDEVHTTSTVILAILLGLRALSLFLLVTFFRSTSIRQASIWCSSSSLLIQFFVAEQIWQQNNLVWIYSFLVLLQLLNGCWKRALCCVGTLRRLVTLYCIFDPWMIVQFIYFFGFKSGNIFENFSLGLFRQI